MYRTRHLTMKLSCVVLFFVASLSNLNAQCCRPFCYECLQEDDGVCHLFYGAQGLYWTTCQSDLNYAVDFDPSDSDAILGEGKTHFLEYDDWKGGVRGWFGWNWAYGWDLKIAYTYFCDEAKGKADTDNQTIDLKASLFHPDSDEEIAESASGKLDLEYQTLDVIFGKVICFCDDTVVLHPFFGARGLRLNQLLKVLYEDEDFDTPGQVKWDSDVKAAGLHAGLDMQYRWKYGWGIYGGFGGSLLASRSDNKHKQRILDEDGKVTSTEIDLKEQQWVSLPGFNVAAGVSWDWCCGKCLLFKVKVGYEFNKWFNTQQIRRYHQGNEGVSSENTSGNIGLHGATFSAEIYF